MPPCLAATIGAWRIPRVEVELELEIVDSRGIKVVFCRGKLLVGKEVEYFKSKVEGLLPEFPNIVLELKGLRRIDSQGVGAIVTLLNKARENGGDVKLASVPQGYVQNVLEMTKMTTVFQIFDDERRAVSAFARTGT